MKDWTEEPIDFSTWQKVPGNPFTDYDPKEKIALWSLWEMPSSALGEPVKRGRGRPKGEPTTVRSVRLPTSTWKRLEQQAANENTTVNALIARLIVS